MGARYAYRRSRSVARAFDSGADSDSDSIRLSSQPAQQNDGAAKSESADGMWHTAGTAQASRPQGAPVRSTQRKTATDLQPTS